MDLERSMLGSLRRDFLLYVNVVEVLLMQLG